MSAHSMAVYAERARVLADPLLASARYAEQREAERRVILDVARKLDLQPSDRLLDVGAGTGSLTIPLSYLVAATVAVDHEDCLARLGQRAGEARITQLVGDFFAIPILMHFDKILAYDVIHYFADRSAVLTFVDKALSLLVPTGRLLLGDLPNVDLRARFAATPFGRDFEARWRAAFHDDGSDRLSLPPDRELVRVDDALIDDIEATAAGLGWTAVRLTQDPRLPFGWTRLDVLIRRS